MTQSAAVLDQLNIVARDVERSIEFYRLLGVDIAPDQVWRTASGPHHVVMRMPDGFELALDSVALARTYNQAWRDADGIPDPAAPSPTVMSLRLAGAEQVDAAYRRATDAGHGSAQPPFYTFWGSRYAIVVDPDGNHVGLMSPPDRARRSAPPDI